MTLTLTREQADPILDAIVDQYGADHVYQKHSCGCLYVFEGQPDCIIGKLFYAFGVSLDVLSRNETKGPTNPVWGEHIAYDEYLAQYLSHIQVMQDEGQAWGYCLTVARTQYPPQGELPYPSNWPVS